MESLFWELPLGVVAGFALIRIFLAPYWIWRDQQDRTDTAAEAVYLLLAKQVEWAFGLTGAHPVSDEDWQAWERGYADWRATHTKLKERLEIHEWQSINFTRHQGPTITPMKPFDERHTDEWTLVFNVLPSLQKLQREYHAKRRGLPIPQTRQASSGIRATVREW